ncbi:xanthine dehydrogenase family protein molybdopterin-binding subunit [Klebsiella sp. 2680]|uniref:xanthine dehydrogenase family protein molybdopterin-binding subunit n=1 Tax=Klebsiella sp. 2680 TaxID=2018037 RepID=UPI0011589FAA|nr:xanthine dehydrogenase family protein molybdopterin-binding subunit [Klebsiella sp. 2680]
MYSDDYKPENYRYIGKVNVPRKDAQGIVTGKTTFLDDFSLPRMLTGKSLKSPYAHARIISINTEKAKALKGVAAVLTYKEADPTWLLGYPPSKPILGQEMQYIGDTVALVAAESAEIAMEAIDLIEVEYEQLPVITNGIDAVKEGVTQLYKEFKNNIVTPGYPPFQKDGPFWHLIRGDVEKGFDECAICAEDTVEFAKMAAPLAPEPPGAIVSWDGGNDYSIWATTQSCRILEVFGVSVIPDCNLHVRSFNVGGSYGNKQSMVVPVISAALLSRHTGRPVKFYQTKAEQLICSETRLGSQVKAKIGMDEEGVVRAVKAQWFVDTGAFCNTTQGQISVGIGEAQLVMAKCANWDLDTYCIVTNKQPAGIVRGYGGQELNSCLSLLMARAMQAGNFDPVECYKKNYVSDGDPYIWRDGRLWIAHSINYVPAIEAAAAKFGWKDKWKGWGVPTWTSEDGTRVRGVGCSIIGNADVGEDNTEAYVRIVPDMVGDKARVILQTDITESGMGQRSNIAKMVAEILNVPYERVELTPPSTKINPTGFGLCGSRGTITYGHAVSNAAENAKKKLCELAVHHLDISMDAMELRDFGVSSKARPDQFVSWKKLIPPDLTLTGYGQHLENFSTPNFFMVLIEVEVNKETGKVDVVRMVGGTDSGQTIDPSMLEMQCQGGIGAASLDTAIYEEHIIDPVTHRTLTFNMLEYKWRPFNEFPVYETSILQSQFDTFQFKAVGVGEIAGASAASATMQAISNAIGIQVAQYPATPDVILQALGKVA